MVAMKKAGRVVFVCISAELQRIQPIAKVKMGLSRWWEERGTQKAATPLSHNVFALLFLETPVRPRYNKNMESSIGFE